MRLETAIGRCDGLKHFRFLPCESGKSCTIWRPLANPPTPGVHQYWLPTCWQCVSPLTACPWYRGSHRRGTTAPISRSPTRFSRTSRSCNAWARVLSVLKANEARGQGLAPVRPASSPLTPGFPHDASRHRRYGCHVLGEHASSVMQRRGGEQWPR
jgi:hypothetical protein